MADEIKLLGPYRFRTKWRCQLVINGKRDWTPLGRTPEEAERTAQRAIEKIMSLRPLSVDDAIDRYAEYLKTKGNKPASYEGTPARLRRFFAPMLAQPLIALTAHRCEVLYRDLTSKPSPRTGRPLAVDSHRAYLAEARSLARWAVKNRLLRLNPVAEIEGIGRRRQGKEQLRREEARRWLDKAHELAQKGEAGAVAAMMTLLLGLRASEVISRVVRDLDDGGRLLWIPHSKTPAGKRTLRIPDEIQPYLRELARDKLPLALLFGHHLRDWPREWVQRICKLAKVPIVTAHGMRGLHATLAIEEGATPDLVARSLGHEHASMTMRAYAAPGSAESARQGRTLRLLADRPA